MSQQGRDSPAEKEEIQKTIASMLVAIVRRDFGSGTGTGTGRGTEEESERNSPWKSV